MRNADLRNAEVKYFRIRHSDFRIQTMGRFQSGQMDQTVNLLSYDFGGSNPPLPTLSVGSGQLTVGS